MAKQSFTTGQVLTSAQMTSLQQTAMNGGSASAKTASYVLVALDAGTRVQMSSGSATTITVNTSLFSEGDVVYIQNIGAGTCTVTAGTATVSKASAVSLSLTQYQAGYLYFSSASAALFFGDASGSGTVTSITAGTGLSGGTITSSGTIAIDSTVATLTGTQTLTNKTIDASTNTLTGVATLTGTQTLTNKTIDAASNTLTGVATLTGTQTLTNKTLTAPLINLAFNAQTGTTYTLVAADSGKLVTTSNASAVTVTIPSGTFAAGEQINIQSIGVGLTTISGSGVTVTSTGATATAPILRARYSAATVIFTASNVATVIGDLS